MIRAGNTSVAPGEPVVAVADMSEDLAAFDALPPPIRQAVAEAPIKLASGPLLAFWRDEAGETGLDCVERLGAILNAVREVRHAD